MLRLVHTILGCWHSMLGLPRFSKGWYRDRLREELQERREAKTLVEKLSETADVFYIITRAQHAGFPVRELPPFAASHFLILSYMVGKITLRWGFYRAAGYLCKSKGREYDSIREVVNPAKDHKLHDVAARHDVNPDEFVQTCLWLRRVWPLLH